MKALTLTFMVVILFATTFLETIFAALAEHFVQSHPFTKKQFLNLELNGNLGITPSL
jgi:hypothetical protein